MANIKEVSFPELSIPPQASNAYPIDPRIMPRNIVASGVLPGNTVIYLGDKNIKISGRDRNITVNDGTNDRILLGYKSGGF